MAHFLVDFENVNHYGLKGINYLNANDTLIIFYTHMCKRIPREYIDMIGAKDICTNNNIDKEEKIVI